MSKKYTRRHFLKVTGAGSVGVLLALSGCGPSATPAPVPASGEQAPAASTTAPAAAPAAGGSKTLRIRLYSDIANLDPAFRVSNNDETVMSCVLSGLVTYGPGSYEIKNDLVESIEQSEDGLEITFKLREGVQWHNGYGEVTTEDVKFSYERFMDEDLNAAYKDDWATLDHVEVLDKYNGKIVLKEPFAPLWTTTLPIGSGYIVCKKHVEEVGAEGLATNLIGSGPYIFSEWTPKQRIVLKRNPDYFGEQPYYDEIHFIPIDDDKTAEVGLEAGEIDFTRISASSVSRFRDNPQFGLVEKPSLRYRWIGMNVENPKLADINVRQAIRYAIDVPGIVQATYMGTAEPERGLVPPGLLGYWEDAPLYQRDVAKAKEFMQKAGIESLDLRMDIEDTTEYRTWAEIAQQNLQEVGINLTINPMDSSSFWELGMGEKAKDVELFSNNYSMQPDPSWASMWFTCDQVDVWNWQRWCKPEFDELHQQALVTTDQEARAEMYIKMQQLWDADCHAIWITHGSMEYGYLPTIKPVVTPHGLMQPIYFTAA